MKNLVFTLALAAISWLTIPDLRSAETPIHPTPESVLLFSFFRDNGQDGLFLATSRDGLTWTELKPPGKSFLAPKLGDQLMRDPCLRRGPDGTLRLVWTTGWKDRILGYSSSRDLVNWTEQQAVPVMMHEPAARNTWAPELFHDDRTGQWLIFWSSTIPGRFPSSEGSSEDQYNHRAYCVTTRDFEVFSPTRLFYDGGFNVIDATLHKVGAKYHLVLKDETLKPERKHLRFATADKAEGPYGEASAPFTISWVEGPSVVRIGEDTIVYFDHYARPQYYGAVRTRDWKEWEDISTRIKLPAGARHGTMSWVPVELIRPLMNADAR